MTASALTTARPPAAAIAWATRDAIFVEIPCKGGPPLIVRYHKTVDGLQQALNIIIDNHEPTHRTISADHPAIKRPKATFTEAQREGVREMLKKLGVIS